MTDAEFIEFENQLQIRGWRYDASEEQFLAGTRKLDWSAVQALVPDGSVEVLSAYQDRKRDEWRRQKPSRQDDEGHLRND